MKKANQGGLLADLKRLTPKEQVSFFIFIPFIITMVATENFVGPNLYEIGRFLGLTSEIEIEQKLGGWLNSITFIVQAVGAIYFGYLTDKLERKTLIIIMLVFMSLSNMVLGLMGIAPFSDMELIQNQSFILFLVFRSISMLSVGAVYGLMISYVGDFFSKKQRAVAVGYMIITHDVSIGLGMVIAGVSGGSPGWHFPFLLFAFFHVVVLVLVLAFAVEVRRGAGEDELMGHILEKNVEYTSRIKIEDLKKIFNIKTNIFILLQSMFGNSPWGAIMIFSVEYFKDKFYVDTSVATLLIIMFLTGSPLGSFIGGYVNRRYAEKTPNTIYLISFGGMIIMAICFSLIFHFPVPEGGGIGSIIAAVAIGVIGSLATGFSNASQKNVMMAVNVPENRGIITALSSVGALIGLAGGTFLFGTFKGYFPADVYAYDVMWTAWILAGTTWLGFLYTVKKDTEDFKNRLQNYITSISSD